jgi:hypothetical protein
MLTIWSTEKVENDEGWEDAISRLRIYNLEALGYEVITGGVIPVNNRIWLLSIPKPERDDRNVNEEQGVEVTKGNESRGKKVKGKAALQALSESVSRLQVIISYRSMYGEERTCVFRPTTNSNLTG